MVSKGPGGPLSSGALKTEQLRFLFYRLIDQSCFIKYLVACRHTLASSFLLFRVPTPGLHMVKNFSVMYRLHLFVTFEYGLARAIIFQVTVNSVSVSFRDQMYLPNSVTFLLVSFVLNWFTVSPMHVSCPMELSTVA